MPHGAFFAEFALMEAALATGCVTCERVAEVVHTGLQFGVRSFLLDASQWLCEEQQAALPEINIAGAKFLGFVGALSGGGCAICGSESDRQHARELLRKLCVDAHHAGGELIMLGGMAARELQMRATTNEIHAQLAEFFDGVMPIFESRNMTLVIDLPLRKQAGKSYCLSVVSEVVHFLDYYCHPLLRVGLGTTHLGQENILGEFFLEKIFPQLAVVMFDGVRHSKKVVSDTTIHFLIRRFNGLLLLGAGAGLQEGIASLARELEKFKSLFE